MIGPDSHPPRRRANLKLGGAILRGARACVLTRSVTGPPGCSCHDDAYHRTVTAAVAPGLTSPITTATLPPPPQAHAGALPAQAARAPCPSPAAGARALRTFTRDHSRAAYLSSG